MAYSAAETFSAMTTLQIELPDALSQELRGLVSAGWYQSEDEAMREALRELLARRLYQVQEEQQMQDIAWALKAAGPQP
jgi:Arc/MetJ-type ribon-helix-helix transcriptional regulator